MTQWKKEWPGKQWELTSSALLLIQEVQIAQRCLPKDPICPSFPHWKWKCCNYYSDFPLINREGKHPEERGISIPQENASWNSRNRAEKMTVWGGRRQQTPLQWDLIPVGSIQPSTGAQGRQNCYIWWYGDCNENISWDMLWFNARIIYWVYKRSDCQWRKSHALHQQSYSQDLQKSRREKEGMKSLSTPVLTWEGDVETLIGHGEVWDEANLSREVSKEPRTKRGREPRARQLLQWLSKAGIFSDEEVVVAILQVKGMKGEEHTCTGGKIEMASASSIHMAPLHPRAKATLLSPRWHQGSSIFNPVLCNAGTETTQARSRDRSAAERTEPSSLEEYFILNVLTFRWVARPAKAVVLRTWKKQNQVVFWKEFIPRKIGLKPSIKVREAFPEDKVCQQCYCRDFIYFPLTGLNAGPWRMEDNRSDHTWTNLFPQPYASREPFTRISQVSAMSHSHAPFQQHSGAASSTPAPCSRAQPSPVLLGGGCCCPFPACDPLPGPAAPSEARGRKRICSHCRFWQGTQSQGG